MIRICLLDFVRTGAFGPVNLGQDHRQIEQHFGPPDDWSAPARGYVRAKIWKYGTTEFHFSNGRLDLIHSDSFEVPEGGGRLILDPWILRRGLPTPDLQGALESEQIPYTREADRYNPGGISVRTAKDIGFLFAEQDVKDPPGLSAFFSPTPR